MLEILTKLPEPLQQACAGAMTQIGANIFGAAWGTLQDQKPEQVLARVCRDWQSRSAADAEALGTAFRLFFTSDAWQTAQKQVLDRRYVEVDFDELDQALDEICDRGGWSAPECGSAPDLTMVMEDLQTWLRGIPEFQTKWQVGLEETIRAVSGPEAAETNYSLARRKYLAALETEHTYVRFMGTAEVGGPTEVGIRQVYVVPRLESRSVGRDADALDRRVEPESFPADRLLESKSVPQRIVVLGKPGSGKSTFGQWAALGLASAQREKLPGCPNLLPVFYRFRDLDRDMAEVSKTVKAPTLWDCLHRRASQLVGLTLPAGFLQWMDKKHGLFVFFDGLDEASRQQHAVSLVSGFSDDLAPGSRVVVTSRPFEYRYTFDPTVYQHLTLDEFADEEIETFIDRWRQARQADSTEARQRADKLWQSIQQREDIHGLARNALLLTMIVRVHFWLGELPDSRVELFAKCADTLLKHWTKAAGLDEGPLDRDEKTLFLSELAFSMQEAEGERLGQNESTLLISEANLRRSLRGFLKREKPDASVDEVVQRLQARDAILVDNGEGRFGFIHRSFQEYFASWWMKEEFGLEELREYEERAGWRETLILAIAQLDSRTRRKLLIQLLRENRLPLAIECVKAGKKVERWLDTLVRFLSKYHWEGEENVGLEPADCAEACGERPETVDLLQALFERENREGRTLAAAVELAEALKEDVPEAAELLACFFSESEEREYGQEKDMVPVDAQPGKHDAFLMDKYLVTNEAFERMIPGRKRARLKDRISRADREPVIRVSGWEARLYCRWRGEGFRLPTEKEWYTAAAWDPETRKHLEYPWGDWEEGKCNTRESERGRTNLVDAFPQGQSAYKCYDMAGNVFEWTETGSDDWKRRMVLRGGSWGDNLRYAACADRGNNRPRYGGFDMGVRCARTSR